MRISMYEEPGRILGKYLMLFFNGQLNHSESVIEADEEAGTMKEVPPEEHGRTVVKGKTYKYNYYSGTVEMMLKPNAPEHIVQWYRNWREYSDSHPGRKTKSCL